MTDADAGAGDSVRGRPPRVRFAVPWRSDGGRRDELWAFVRAQLEADFPGVPIVEGRSPDGPFNRSAAINDAAQGEWDVLVVFDADVLIPQEQLKAAVRRSCATERAVLAFTRYSGLTPNMTKRVMTGWQGEWDRGARYRSDEHESSCVVIPRSVWEITGGFDERFVGWGQEDVAFIQAARLLVGPIERVNGYVYHLWHPKSDDRRRQGGVNYQGNQALGQRYRDAHTAEAVRELIQERGVDLSQRAERFDRIYTLNEWRGTGGTRAGPGSSLSATAALQEALPNMVADLGCTSVLDAGCSDGLWMPELPDYVGVDIVPRAIAVARKRHPGRRYEVADICTDPLPACDAVICRDALQHLSFADGLAALQNFRRTGAKYLLANTHRGGTNQDIVSGEWYEIDLEAGPWWLGAPVRELPDGRWADQNRYPNKVFGAWEL